MKVFDELAKATKLYARHESARTRDSRTRIELVFSMMRTFFIIPIAVRWRNFMDDCRPASIYVQVQLMQVIQSLKITIVGSLGAPGV
jgi:hypothetical protein